YGRVLVERVEGFASVPDWRRAYEEIRHWESLLVSDGTILIKFFLHISSKEQKRRFESRAEDPLRQWKLTDEDWRNRKRRKDYEEAIVEMVEKTDTVMAPWTIVAAEQKRFARIKVLDTVIRSVEAALG
ncbi:MAG: UDP-galactose-lipid carrier transferase, partial [Caldilineaceae bacterium SB0668_bin_21]|nr:UDP-galactose-lipid carrier transferase [Caldilineaceae bacterium SB0668_bin_21]